ncbi:MAG: hypothetical protein WD577_01640 [Bacteroidales bacterium]
MTKKIILSLVTAILGITVLHAQRTDRVILKNGTTIIGDVEKIIPEESITINDRAGNSWVFTMADVAEIDKVEVKRINGGSDVSLGWVNMSTIGVLAGSQQNNYIAPFSMHSSFGYFSGKGIYTGLLAGLEFLNINHIPLMADLQYALGRGDVVPVVIARGGYALPSKWEDSYHNTDYTYHGGIAGAIGVGLKIGSRDNFAWDVSLLYRHMQINYTESYEWQSFDNTYKDIYNRIEFRVGFYLGVKKL